MITVIENQTLVDIAIQEDGNPLAVIDWAEINQLPVSSVLIPGQKLKVPLSKNRNSDVVAYFKGRNQKVTTAPVEVIETTNPFGFPYGFPLAF